MLKIGWRGNTELCTLALIAFSLHHAKGRTSTHTVSVTTSCSPRTMETNEYTTYLMTWDGVDPGENGCTMKFWGGGGDGSAYKVCVDTSKFFIEGPGIHVRYESDNGKLVEYGVNEFPGTFCTEPNDRLKVSVYAEWIGFGRLRRPTRKSYFTLKITAYPTEEDKSLSSSTVLAIVAGIVVFLIVVIFIYVRCTKGKQKRDVPANEEEDDLRPHDVLHSHDRIDANGRNYNASPVRMTSPARIYSDQSYTPSRRSSSSSESEPESGLQRDFDYPTSVQQGGCQTNNLPSAPPEPHSDNITSGILPPSYEEVMNMSR